MKIIKLISEEWGQHFFSQDSTAVIKFEQIDNKINTYRQYLHVQLNNTTVIRDRSDNIENINNIILYDIDC